VAKSKAVAKSPIHKTEARTDEKKQNLYDAIRRYFEPFGGFDLDIPPREPMREPPDFSGPEYDLDGPRAPFTPRFRS
jgi:hypothetical protein